MSSDGKMHTDLAELAQHYWREGWNVLPVDKEKRPIVKTWKQWEIYRQSQDDVTRMPWKEAEGVAGVTGLEYVAIDIDVENLEKARNFIRGLPKTRVHKTCSGGSHLIYQSKKACASYDKFRKKFGIEIQAVGNYILLPGSFDGKYEIVQPEVPPTLVDDLESLILKRAQQLGWKEREDPTEVAITAETLKGVNPWDLKCVMFIAENPIPEGSRELVLGKNLAVLAYQTLGSDDEIKQFAEDMTRKHSDGFKDTDILGWVRWAREKQRDFNHREIVTLLREYYHDFNCDDCPMTKLERDAEFKKNDPPSTPTTLTTLLDFWHEHYYIEDDVSLQIELAVAISNQLDGDPVWLMIVGPPSSIKTEMIRALGEEPNSLVFPLSTLTENTFLSGYGKKFSLLPKIDQKILALKDFTSILQKNKDTRNEILSQLREIYDGYLSKGTGSEANYQNEHCRVTVITGVTEVIELYDSIQSLLGDRFLRVRVESGDPKKVAESARKATGLEGEIRKKLNELTLGFLNSIKVSRLELSTKAHDYITELAIFTSKARTSVVRGFNGVISYMPKPEGIARLFKQFLKLSWCLAAVLGKTEVDDNILRLLKRVAMDTVEHRRITLLRHIDSTPRKTSEIAGRANLPTDTAKPVLEELALLGLAVREGDENHGYEWTISSDECLAIIRQ